MKNLCGFSGGKDSTALLVWALRDSGYDPTSLRFTFCDTGNEAPETYEYIQEYLPKTLGVEIITLKPELDFYELAAKKGMFPNPVSRFCTEHLKIIPTREYIRGLLAEGHEIVSHNGSRRSESHNRRDIPEWSEKNWGSAKSPLMVTVRSPLYLWTLQDVFDYLKKHGVKLNPLYERGAERVGCYPCIMSKLPEIATIPTTRIEELAEREQEVNRVIEERGKKGIKTPFFPTQKIPVQWRDVAYTGASGQRGTCASVKRVHEYAMQRQNQTEMLPFQETDWEALGAVCPGEGTFCE